MHIAPLDVALGRDAFDGSDEPADDVLGAGMANDATGSWHGSRKRNDRAVWPTFRGGRLITCLGLLVAPSPRLDIASFGFLGNWNLSSEILPGREAFTPAVFRSEKV